MLPFRRYTADMAAISKLIYGISLFDYLGISLESRSNLWFQKSALPVTSIRLRASLKNSAVKMPRCSPSPLQQLWYRSTFINHSLSLSIYLFHTYKEMRIDIERERERESETHLIGNADVQLPFHQLINWVGNAPLDIHKCTLRPLNMAHVGDVLDVDDMVDASTTNDGVIYTRNAKQTPLQKRRNFDPFGKLAAILMI